MSTEGPALRWITFKSTVAARMPSFQVYHPRTTPETPLALVMS